MMRALKALSRHRLSPVACMVWMIAAAGAAAQAGPGADKLHIPQGRSVSLTHVMTDGGGYRWDIRNYGGPQHGTNYVYDNGMMLQLPSSEAFNTPSAWQNERGDEIELGPVQSGPVQVWRRIRVYGDRPLARWLDIFTNTAAHEVSLPIVIRTDVNYGIAAMTTSSGDGRWRPDDWHMTTRTNNPQSSALLHILCDPKTARIRPTVQQQRSRIMSTYRLKIPAGKTVIVCMFQSQSTRPAEHESLLAEFHLGKLLADLPPAVRAMIVNFDGLAGVDMVQLERSDQADLILLTNGDEIFGQIADRPAAMTAFFGPIEVPARKIIGMAMDPERPGRATVVLTDGQLITGQCAWDALEVTLSVGGTLQVPIHRIRQWSYRISDDRPDNVTFDGPIAVLQTGDRLAFDPGATPLKLLSPYGLVDLQASDLLAIQLDNPSHAVHRVTFGNETVLAGLLQPAKIPLTLRLGPDVVIPREMVRSIRFATDSQTDDLLTTVILANGDMLKGRLTDEQIELAGDFGRQTLSPSNLRLIQMTPTHPGRAALTLWDGTVLRGQLTASALGMQVSPGPTMSVPLAQIVSVQRAVPLPPEQIVEQVEALVVRLGAESYQDRQSATDELVEIGSSIAPLLKRHLQHEDPEIRQRVEQILDRLGGGSH